MESTAVACRQCHDLAAQLLLDPASAGLPRKLLVDWAMDTEAHRRLMEWDQNSTTTNIIYIVIVILLVCGSGLMSGLTLGLLSLDMVEMEVLKRSGTPSQKRNAERIMPVIKNTHLLLVTLLLCNAACMEALPIFLNGLVNEWQAIIISVTAILAFGEIIPQSICKRHGLAIGAFLAWPVRILMIFCSPIAWPIGKLLDYLLEHETHSMFRRGELKALVDMHGADEGLGGKLSDDEVQIICGALDLTNKIAFLGMTPLPKVVMLSTNDKFDRATLKMVLDSGHSRLPVYEGNNRSNIIGLILTKDLLNYTLEDEVPIHCMRIRPLPRLSATTPMYDMLKLFRTGRSHMAVLTQPMTGDKDLQPLTSAMMDRSNRKVRSLSNDRAAATLLTSRSNDRPSGGLGMSSSGAAAADSQPARARSSPEMTCAEEALPKAASAAAPVVARAVGEGTEKAPPQPPPAVAADEGAADSGRPSNNGRAVTPLPPVKEVYDGSSGAAPAPPVPPPPPQKTDEELSKGTGVGHVSIVMDAGQREIKNGAPDESEERSAFEAHAHPSLIDKILGRESRPRGRRGSTSSKVRRPSSSSSSSSGSSKATEEVPVTIVPPIADPGTSIGIITIEDVIEELMGREILDETDHFADNERTIKVNENLRKEMDADLDDRMRALISSNLVKTARRISDRSTQGGMSTGQLRELLEATATITNATTTAPAGATNIMGGGFVPIGGPPMDARPPVSS